MTLPLRPILSVYDLELTYKHNIFNIWQIGIDFCAGKDNASADLYTPDLKIHSRNSIKIIKFDQVLGQIEKCPFNLLLIIRAISY